MKNIYLEIFDKQKKFFGTGILNNVDYRKQALIRLKREIKKNEKSIQKAH